jgi:hypothetical protein
VNAPFAPSRRSRSVCEGASLRSRRRGTGGRLSGSTLTLAAAVARRDTGRDD